MRSVFWYCDDCGKRIGSKEVWKMQKESIPWDYDFCLECFKKNGGKV